MPRLAALHVSFSSPSLMLTLDAMVQNRMRGESRTYETVNQKMQTTEAPIQEEGKHRENLQTTLDEKIEVTTASPRPAGC